MKLPFLLVAAFSLTPLAPCGAQEPSPVVVQARLDCVTLDTDTASFRIDDKGELAAITRRPDGKNLIAAGRPSPVLRLHLGGKDRAPDAASWDAAKGLLTLRYGEATATVSIKAKASHLTLELVGLDSPGAPVDLILWGPYSLVIGTTIGESVGVVRDGETAVGIQSLNAKTQGGEPVADGWESHRFQAKDGAHDGIEASEEKVLHFGTTAKAAPFGSLLQMHCFGHERGETIAPFLKKNPCANLGPSTPSIIPGASVVGTKIALFACPESQALATIGRIETAEGLPHPVFRGKWVKDLSGTDLRYFCFQFGEDTIDDFIALAKKADISMLYHNSPWASWGRFPLKPRMFPGGYDGLKACVSKAHAAGMTVGAHTLSGFITADDPYVVNNDPRLAVKNASGKKITMNYNGVIHFGNRELAGEVMKNCADILVKTGLDQWEFDGLESNTAMGIGGEGRNVMLDTWRDALPAGTRDRVLLGSSAMDNYAWHVFYGGNWGEPWYGPFRESRTDYRLACVRFQMRNLLPRMLGQFIVHPGGKNVKPGDIDWLMALATGFDAGFSLTFDVGGEAYIRGRPASHKEWLSSPNMNDILATIRRWNEAAKAGAFTPETKARLRDPKREFRLEEAGPGCWNLYPVENGKRGEPVVLKASSGKNGPPPAL